MLLAAVAAATQGPVGINTPLNSLNNLHLPLNNLHLHPNPKLHAGPAQPHWRVYSATLDSTVQPRPSNLPLSRKLHAGPEQPHWRVYSAASDSLVQRLPQTPQTPLTTPPPPTA